MARQVVVPSLGLGTGAGHLVELARPDGASVEPGDPVALFESEHVLVEVEAHVAGILRCRPGSSEGLECHAGDVLAVLLEPGERLAEDAFASEPGDGLAAAAFRDDDGEAEAPAEAEAHPPMVLPLRRHTLPEAAPPPPESTWARIPGDDVIVGDEWISEDGEGAGLAFGPAAGADAGEGPSVSQLPRFGLALDFDADAPAEFRPSDAGREPTSVPINEVSTSETDGAAWWPGEATFESSAVAAGEGEATFESSAAAAGEGEATFESSAAAAGEGEAWSGEMVTDEERVLPGRDDFAAAEQPAQAEPTWEERFAQRFAGQQSPAFEPPLKHHAEDPRPYFDVAPYAEGVTEMERGPSQEDAPGAEVAEVVVDPAAGYAPDPDFAFVLPVERDERGRREVLALRVRVDLRECRKMAAQLGREWPEAMPTDEDIVLRAFGRALEGVHFDVLVGDLAIVVPGREGAVTTAIRDAARRPFREAVQALARGGDGDFEGSFVGRLLAFASLRIDEAIAGLEPHQPLSLALGAPREWAMFEGERVVPVMMADLVLTCDVAMVPPGEAAWLLGRVRELLEAPYALLAA